MENSNTSGQVQQADPNRNNSQIVILERGTLVAQPRDVTTYKPILRLSSRQLMLLGLLGTGAIAIAASVNHWLDIRSYEETDNAYVASDTYPINTRIMGQVTTVVATENQVVKKGTVLVKVEPKNYEAKLQKATMALAVTQEQVKTALVNLRAASAIRATKPQQTQILGANAAFRVEAKSVEVRLRKQQPKFVKAQSDYERLVKLNQKGIISLPTLNQAKSNYDVLLLKRNKLVENFKGAQTKLSLAQLNFLDAQIKLAQEKIEKAQKNFAQAQTKIAQQKTEKARISPSPSDKQLNLITQQKKIAAQAEQKKIATLAAQQAEQQKLTAQLTKQQKIIAQLVEQKKLVAQQAEATFKQHEYEVSLLGYKAAQNAEAAAKAQVKTAQYQLYYTKIIAPNNGQINIKRVQLGQKIQPGQTLMALVQQKPWIAANFPEEQLKKIKPGQSVQIKINTLSDKTFKGKVQSILPPSKAKYYHLRPPVKISFDPTTLGNYKSRIIPGTPASVKVNLDQNGTNPKTVGVGSPTKKWENKKVK